MIKLVDVSKFYKTQTGVAEGMRKVNLEFKLNEFVAITGESGSGKTTLLNVISGLDSYEDGEMFVNGLETSHYTVKEWELFRATNVGFVFQNYNVIDSYSVYQNVVIALEAQGYDKTKKKERALELIERVGLTSHKNQKTSKLSGGQKQRVVIARALAKNAPIILADEPTGNLDVQSGKEIMELLKEISKDKLIILVTHNYLEAKDYVTRNVIMSDGNIKEDRLVNENPEILIDRIEEQELSDDSLFKVSSKIASRNILATPKRSIFNILLSMVAIIIFVSFYTSLIKNSVFFTGLSENIGYVQLRSDEDFDKNSFTIFKESFDNNNYAIVPKIPSLYVETIENGVLNDVLSVKSSEYLKNTKLKSGRLPEKKGEVVLFESIPDYISRRDAITIRDLDGNIIEYQIVGIFNEQLYIDGYSHLELYMHPSELYNDNLELNNSYFEEEAIQSIAVFAKDRPELLLFKQKLNNSNDTYRFIDEYQLIENQMGFVIDSMNIFNWAILVGVLSIVFLVLYHVQKNIMESRKKDFAVYRSIGINEKEVSMTVIFEQIIITIVAILAVLIIFETLAIFFEFFRKITRHLNIWDYLLVGVSFSLFSIFQGFRFNKKIFGTTVIESLKEDN